MPARVADARGRPVLLVAPDLLSAPPHRVAVDGGAVHEVEGWAGPWPLRERWWTAGGTEGSRVQVACAGGIALLLLGRADRWEVTGIYD